MEKKTRSLLEELQSISNKHDTSHVVESRGSHVITSVINLLDFIKNNYPPEKAEILEKKMFVAIRARDPEKFSKYVKQFKKRDLNAN